MNDAASNPMGWKLMHTTRTNAAKNKIGRNKGLLVTCKEPDRTWRRSQRRNKEAETICITKTDQGSVLPKAKGAKRSNEKVP